MYVYSSYHYRWWNCHSAQGCWKCAWCKTRPMWLLPLQVDLADWYISQTEPRSIIFFFWYRDRVFACEISLKCMRSDFQYWFMETWDTMCMQTALQTWTYLVTMFNVPTCCMLQCVCEKQAHWLLCSSSLPHTSCCILAHQTARRSNRVTWN